MGSSARVAHLVAGVIVGSGAEICVGHVDLVTFGREASLYMTVEVPAVTLQIARLERLAASVLHD